ncbi:hypothetical protein PINS_up001834 [Pythium insidiosum]|nr:hypothetical protein PINS_up001834 [Pythium insidiosum]
MPADQKVMSAFILSVICHEFPQGQKACLQQYLHKICGHLSSDAHDDVRLWCCLSLAKVWEGYEDAKRLAIEDKAAKVLSQRLRDERAEVRAAAAVALGTLVGLQFDGSLYGANVDRAYVDEFLRQRAHSDIVVASELLVGCQDASALVRRESVLALANVVLHTYHQPRFEAVAAHYKDHAIVSTESQSQNQNQSQSQSHSVGDNDSRLSSVVGELRIDTALEERLGADAKYYVQIWHVLKEMQARDPFPKVVQAVRLIVSKVNAAVLAATAAEQVAAAATTVSATSGPISTGGIRQQPHEHSHGHTHNHTLQQRRFRDTDPDRQRRRAGGSSHDGRTRAGRAVGRQLTRTVRRRLCGTAFFSRANAATAVGTSTGTAVLGTADASPPARLSSGAAVGVLRDPSRTLQQINARARLRRRRRPTQ